MGDKMDNQNLNNDSSQNNVSNTNSTNVNQNSVNLMRETVDQNGNVVNPTSNQQPDLADKTINAVENFMNTTDHKSEYNSEEVKKYKNQAMICYIPFVSLYFVLTSKYKSSGYLKFHTNQGLIVTIGWVLSFFISKILGSLFTGDSFLLNNTPGWVSFISYILYCVCFLLTLYGIINTVNDSSKEFPLIGKFKLLK